MLPMNEEAYNEMLADLDGSYHASCVEDWRMEMAREHADPYDGAGADLGELYSELDILDEQERQVRAMLSRVSPGSYESRQLSFDLENIAADKFYIEGKIRDLGGS